MQLCYVFGGGIVNGRMIIISNNNRQQWASLRQPHHVLRVLMFTLAFLSRGANPQR